MIAYIEGCMGKMSKDHKQTENKKEKTHMTVSVSVIHSGKQIEVPEVFMS